MLTKSKQRLLLGSLKTYHKKYLKKLNPDLDESGTRIMINALLADVLGFTPIDEIKTEQSTGVGLFGTFTGFIASWFVAEKSQEEEKT